MSWSTLSEDVWKLILVQLPLKLGLRSCSSVSKTLNRAAAAATRHIELQLYQEKRRVQRLLGLCQWMLQHGQHLTSLRLSAFGGPLTELPCPNLRDLDLGGMRVQLSASSTQPGVLHSCTRVTKLRLHCNEFVDEHSSLAALSSLVWLQDLTMVAVSGSTDDAGMPSTVLQHLTQLTALFLDSLDQLLNADSLQHVSCLVNLRELIVYHSTVPLSPSTTPGWSRLTALRKVSLQRVNFDPSILQDCTQLQGLELQGVAIISAVYAAALHSLLGRLQQLQSLKLKKLEYDWPAAAAAYSSLTASSHLQRLELRIDNLPPGIWPHVFPPDCHLPVLQELTMASYDEEEDEEDERGPPPPSAAGTDDLSCIIRCCPGLERINIDVQPGAELSDLGKASGLTNLWVSGLHEGTFESLGALSGLVRLEDLGVDLGGPITPQDLMCLTALTAVTRLYINPNTAPAFDGDDDVYLDLDKECYLGMPRKPPVWLQLLKHCGKFSECHPSIFDSMGQQLAAQQQQIAELQAQLAATRAQAAVEAAAAAAEAGAAAAAAAVAAQAAAAAAAAEAGELRGRLQALEGHVQQLLQAMLHPGS